VTSTELNPQHLYSAPGVFDVMLIANNQWDCPDTFRVQGAVTGRAAGDLVFPNAFTPSNTGPTDGVYDPASFSNDYFFPVFEGVEAYKLQVFNRWGEVVFESVSFAYRSDEPILDKLSFRIAAGEHVAIVGPTGSGKSTVIRLLCRLYEPQAGRILLDGVDIRELPIATLRQRLGVVLQDTFLFSGNVADNLRLDAAISDQELERLCGELGLKPLLDRLDQGLASELRERGANLSSGERQLLAVARVAIRDPSVLVMDEATAFLDPSTEATLQSDLDRLLRDRTAIVIAHRLATVEAADRILVLRQGRLIEQGNHLELRRAGGLYAQLADLQEKGLAAL
jgi:ATP-binding cassette subfamily B protein